MNRGILAVGLLAASVLGCNLLQGGTPAPQGVTGSQTDAPPPQVAIEAPPNGSQAVVNKGVDIRVHATDSVGITRVEMRESGRVVASQPSPDPDPDFTALMHYLPTRTGAVTLEVVAYRASVVSNTATINIQVVGSEAELSNPGSFNPTSGVAGGAICTVRPNVSNLNMRGGPGVSYRILTTLTVGESLIVIGRNADSSWYQVKRANATVSGWVSASYTSADGDCSKAPVTTPAP
jgi:hypothetical protein